MEVLGIDVGGSGIKGAPVDIDTGQLLAPRQRLSTPHPATPEGVAKAVGRLAQVFSWEGPVGCAVPSAVRDGVALSAANIHRSFIGCDVRALLEKATGSPVAVLNDADAAGLAEMVLGAGRGEDGQVLVLTFGTGIGSALFVGGALVPNTELGHLEVDGEDAERRAAERARLRHGLSWTEWSVRVNRYLEAVETVLYPDLIVIGGGASNKADKFTGRLKSRARLVPASFRNQAGIIGAALAYPRGPALTS
ncbi:MAG: ROK family protein [Acidimicrobiales bacterium]|nr:ROK family protein [Acidimicrobiales bacterium]